MKKRIKQLLAAAGLAVMTMVAAPALTHTGLGVMQAQAGETYTVRVESGYLALRTAKAYDYNNEIGKLYTGESVDVQSKDAGQYWYVYAPSLGKYGYVNKDYLYAAATNVTADQYTVPAYTVNVDSGYLALRTAMAYDAANEIGKLYTGEKVLVTEVNSNTYWYVYAPSLGKFGYVNASYLTSGASLGVSASAYTARVESGYLALRTAKAFDAANEIGKIYTGEAVWVLDSSDSQYWYVYAPTLTKFGYVNKDYLYAGGAVVSSSARTVRVESGYLALRTAKAYDYNNEIGKLYTGDTVQIQDASDSQYWYVYAPTLNKYGYVNKDYLY